MNQTLFYFIISPSATHSRFQNESDSSRACVVARLRRAREPRHIYSRAREKLRNMIASQFRLIIVVIFHGG